MKRSASQLPPQRPVVVIGAGLAGLTVALRLAADRQVIVLAKRNLEEAATAWALTLPDRNARSTALTLTAENWGRTDPLRAGAYFSALPSGPDRDQALGQFISSYAFSHPRKAADWVKSIRDPHVRAQATKAVDRFWKKQDPQAAAAWVAQIGPGT